MAHSAAPGLPLHNSAPPQGWGCRGPPDPEGYSSSSSPASPDSCGLSPPAADRGPHRDPAAPRLRGAHGARRGVRGPGPGVPRQSASEREKLRMRRLAQALLRLRHYLPPALAPPGQSLTKIETLRLAIRYIAHLSALLGLSQGGLARRRGAAPRHCPLCPQGLGCCQSPAPRLHPPAPRDAAPTGTLGWGSPHMVGSPPELLGAPDTEMVSWGSPPYGSSEGTPPEMLGVPNMETGVWGSPLYDPAATTPTELQAVPDMEMGAWGSPPYIPAGGTRGDEFHVILDMGKSAWGSSPYIPATETPLELQGAVISNEPSWPSPPQHAGSETLPDAPGDPLLDAGLMLPELVDVGTVTQDLSMDLLSLLEALLPPQPRH